MLVSTIETKIGKYMSSYYMQSTSSWLRPLHDRRSVFNLAIWKSHKLCKEMDFNIAAMQAFEYRINMEIYITIEHNRNIVGL